MNFIRVIIISLGILFYSNCVIKAQQDFFKNKCSEIECETIINIYNDTVSSIIYSEFGESVTINNKNYYPFIFGKTLDDTIGYIRFYCQYGKCLKYCPSSQLTFLWFGKHLEDYRKSD